jgi:TetR/AcrR family transcriptional regulator, cholesterol catabolism regulator
MAVKTTSTAAVDRDMSGLVLQGVPHPGDLAPHLRRRYDAIVQAAMALLDDAAYEEIPIRGVAERAGVALATVYRYFTSKEHLYAAAMLEWSASLRERMAAGFERPRDGTETAAAIQRVVRAYTEHPQLLRVHLLLEHSADSNARAICERYLTISESSFNGLCRWLPEDRTGAAATTLLAVLCDGLRRWSIGRWTTPQVEHAISDAVELVAAGAGHS